MSSRSALLPSSVNPDLDLQFSIATLSPEAYNQIFPQLLTLSATELVAQFGESSSSEG